MPTDPLRLCRHWRVRSKIRLHYKRRSPASRRECGKFQEFHMCSLIKFIRERQYAEASASVASKGGLSHDINNAGSAIDASFGRKVRKGMAFVMYGQATFRTSGTPRCRSHDFVVLGVVESNAEALRRGQCAPAIPQRKQLGKNSPHRVCHSGEPKLQRYV